MRWKLFGALAGLLFLGALSACKNIQLPTTPQVTLSVTFSGSGQGQVTVTPPGITKSQDFTQSYDQGDQVTLTASPASGSTFLNWQGDCTGSAPCTLPMDTDKNVTAVFQTAASGNLTIYGPSDFSANTLTVSLPNLQSGERVAVIPIYASQDISPTALTYSIQTTNVVAPSPAFSVAEALSSTSPLVPSDADILEASAELVNQARARGIKPLGQGVSPQAFQNCPGPYSAGSTQCTFYVISDRTTNPVTQTQITATVQYVSNNAVWFVQDGLSGDDLLTSSELQDLATAFENTIFPKITNVFGPATDVDGNNKIFIVLSPLVGDAGLFGYVYSVDLFPDGTFTGIRSNEGDIFYATTPGPPINTYGWSRTAFLSYGLPGTMAHELKHLVATGYRVLNGDPYEEAWVEEPSAEVAKELTGYGTSLGRIQARANVALPAPQDYRIVYDQRPGGIAEQAMYGFNFLLLWRIHEQYGGDSFWKPWVQSGLTGIANLESQTGTTFEDLMVDWALTLLFDNTAFFANYQYNSLDLRDGTWTTLGYQNLVPVANQPLRSMAYYLGQGTGTDATVTINVDDPTKVRVVVARFPGALGY